MKTLPLLLLALAIIGLPAHAGEPDLTPPHSNTLAPYFIVLADKSEGESEPLPLKRTDVDVTISGIIADVSVRQTYDNTGSKVFGSKFSHGTGPLAKIRKPGHGWQ